MNLVEVSSENALYSVAKCDKRCSYNLFYLVSSLKYQYNQLTPIYNKEKHQIYTFANLNIGNVCDFCLKND